MNNCKDLDEKEENMDRRLQGMRRREETKGERLALSFVLFGIIIIHGHSPTLSFLPLTLNHVYRLLFH